MKMLLDEFPNATFVDATSMLQAVRAVKSEKEIACLKKSTELIELGVEAKIAAAKPGVKDYEVWAEAIYALIRNGSELPVHYNWVSGPESTRTLSRPSHRILEIGDRIEDELEASWQGYRAQCVQPVWVGQAEPIYHDLIKVQRDAYQSIMNALRPGVTVRELMNADDEAVAEASPSSGPLAGCKISLTMHGRGQGDDRPLITNPRSSVRYLDLRLDQGNVFILKPRVATADGAHGVNWGDTVAIGPDGGYRLGARPHDIRVSEA